jgi:hypothetical protein
MKNSAHPSGKQRFTLECCTVLQALVPMFLFKFSRYESSTILLETFNFNGQNAELFLDHVGEHRENAV